MIRKFASSQNPVKEMFDSFPKRPGVTTTYENSYHFWGPDYVNQLEELALNEYVEHKIRGADPLDIDGDLAKLFENQGLSEPEDGVFVEKVPAEGFALAEDLRDLIYLSSDNEVVAMLEFEKGPAADLNGLKTVAEEPLRIGLRFRG